MYTEEIGALIHHLVEGGTLWGLPPGAVDVYCTLLSWAREGSGRARVSPRTIASRAGLSVEAVDWLLCVLAVDGLIRRVKVKTAKRERTDYIVQDPGGVLNDSR